MKTEPIIVFILDDELPKIPEFRESGVYNSAITKDNLYHLAVNSEWNHLTDLQQLIKDVIASKACDEDGLIDIFGFSTPTQALTAISNKLIPDVIIYDWEYPNAPIYSQNAQNWLLEMLKNTSAFIFVYSKMADDLPKLLNESPFLDFTYRFQLFLKSWKIKSSFSSEEFILQYIIGSATNSGNIKIDGIPIKFTSNDYLEKASDILFLQRVLGSQYVIDQMNNLDFTINEASVEKILNDSALFLYINRHKGYLITPTNMLLQGMDLSVFEEISYLNVLKEFSSSKLEDTIERGILYL